MKRQVEAVVEDGVLRPVEPLNLPDKQRVLITIWDVPRTRDVDMAVDEQRWIREHGREYPGQWVALDGSLLVSHGPNILAVRDEARRKGVPLPLVHWIPEEPELPWAGWL